MDRRTVAQRTSGGGVEVRRARVTRANHRHTPSPLARAKLVATRSTAVAKSCWKTQGRSRVAGGGRVGQRHAAQIPTKTAVRIIRPTPPVTARTSSIRRPTRSLARIHDIVISARRGWGTGRAQPHHEQSLSTVDVVDRSRCVVKPHQAHGHPNNITITPDGRKSTPGRRGTWCRGRHRHHDDDQHQNRCGDWRGAQRLSPTAGSRYPAQVASGECDQRHRHED